ncbi:MULTISPECIES: hypothetical protein [Bacillus]|uniref:Uncharacterized protein n=2 Tax=Bacillus amyloliquefaciens group TaxID=1938374 RepID=I2C907_BACAY|nr:MULTISPECIES: hypothetical protein [Bacillus]AFJ63131.1 hypothetical protein MUS_3247 [Bacillus velezensis YAU B9601-Y2]MCM8509138.1 hypothetical protein [Bacillus amyloliquefaciens]MCR9041728.1 hypothetical protein [Bacillus velezensis]MCV2522225.1 hypothetical protein [Bacillus velezensis]MCX2736403.1 hypothetical protein [Bacillus sp. AnS8]
MSTWSGVLTIRDWYEAALRNNYYSLILLIEFLVCEKKNGAAAGFGRGAEFLFTREI